MFSSLMKVFRRFLLWILGRAPLLNETEEVVWNAIKHKYPLGVHLWELSGFLPDYTDEQIESAADGLRQRGLVEVEGDDIYNKYVVPTEFNLVD